jgi:hypothetical protein
MKMRTDNNGNPIPVLGIGAKGFNIDGSSGSALSDELEAAVYRLSPIESVEEGVHYTTGEDTAEDPLEAEDTDTYLAVGAIESIFIPYGHKIAVLNGVLNVTRLV